MGIGAVGVEVQIFERRAKAAGAPQQVAEPGAAGPRQRRDHVETLGRLAARGEIEFGLVAGVGFREHQAPAAVWRSSWSFVSVTSQKPSCSSSCSTLVALAIGAVTPGC